MGNYMAKAMDDNFKKNQEFMREMQAVTVQRQIQMQNQIRERMAATQIAMARERLAWLGSFYIIATLGMVKMYRKTRKASSLVAFVPLSFLVGYQADLAYGTKLNRVKIEAENILMYERDLIEMPAGLPTLESLDAASARKGEDASK